MDDPKLPYDLLTDAMAQLSDKYGLTGDNRVSTENIEQMMEHAEEIHGEAKKSISEQYPSLLGIAKAQMTSLVYLAITLVENQAKSGFLSQDWPKTEGRPDPNLVIGAAFFHLANYCHAVIALVEKGLDAPARALVRSVTELCLIIVIITGDRDAYRTYVSAGNENNPKDSWYRLFSSKHLEKRIAKVERQIGIPEPLVLGMRQLRKERAEFFSQAVHHSYVSVTASAFPTIPGTDRVQIAILGGPNIASGITLGELVSSVQYCLAAAFSLARGVHGATGLEANDLYKKAQVLFDAVHPMISELAEEDNG